MMQMLSATLAMPIATAFPANVGGPDISPRLFETMFEQVTAPAGAPAAAQADEDAVAGPTDAEALAGMEDQVETGDPAGDVILALPCPPAATTPLRMPVPEAKALPAPAPEDLLDNPATTAPSDLPIEAAGNAGKEPSAIAAPDDGRTPMAGALALPGIPSPHPHSPKVPVPATDAPAATIPAANPAAASASLSGPTGTAETSAAVAADPTASTPPAETPPMETPLAAAPTAEMPEFASAALMDRAPTPDTRDAPSRLSEAYAPPRAPTAEPSHPVADAVVRSRDGQVEVLLNPVELGRVTVLLGAADDPGHLALFVERAETLDLIRRHSDQLLRDLRDSGMPDANLSLLGHESGGQPRDRGARRPGDAWSRHLNAAVPEAEPPPRRVSLSRLDIRV